jgi:hypothetical protein
MNTPPLRTALLIVAVTASGVWAASRCASACVSRGRLRVVDLDAAVELHPYPD